nr:SDR family oxidoreductase [uncultured Dethiosulfovibrio sp.]
MKILILGCSGMLGHKLFQTLSDSADLDVYGTTRDTGFAKHLPEKMAKKVRPHVDATNFDSVIRALASIQPDLVINGIGLIKQLPEASDPLSSITTNSQLPHRISLVCRTAGARMIHISTDCVFKGDKGHYTEEDPSDATDLYGKTKYLGEVEYPHCVTLRTSIIGHEHKGGYGLVEWFLSQEGKKVQGYTNAIFSGLTTLELSNVIHKHIIPDSSISGLYQVSTDPISKYDLINTIKDVYNLDVEIEPFDDFKLDRSLESHKFRKKTGYNPPSWRELIESMNHDYNNRREFYAH